MWVKCQSTLSYSLFYIKESNLIAHYIIDKSKTTQISLYRFKSEENLFTAWYDMSDHTHSMGGTSSTMAPSPIDTLSVHQSLLQGVSGR